MLLIALLLCLPQDADVGTLLRRLRDDAPDVREEATKALIGMGPAVRPAVEAAMAGTTDADVRARLEEVLREIDFNETLARVFGPPVLVSVDADDRPLREVVASLPEVTVDPAVAGRRVTFSARNAPLFQVLRDLCAATEGIYPDLGGRNLNGGRFHPEAMHVQGPIAVQASEVRFTRSVDGNDRKDLEIVITTTHQENVRPLGIEVNLHGYRPGRHASYSGGEVPRVVTHVFERKEPIDAEVRTLDLRGSATYHFPIEDAPVELEVPEKGKRNETRLRDGRFEFYVERDDEEDQVQVGLKFSYPGGTAGRSYFNVFRRRFRDDRIEFLDARGRKAETRRQGGGSRSSSGGSIEYVDAYSNVTWEETPPARVRVTLPSKLHPYRIPFEFKGVPLD